MDIHIGKEIEKKYKQSGIKLSEFAKRLNTGTRNVYSIFERTDISSSQLKQISEILRFNFFDLYQRTMTRTAKSGDKIFVTGPQSATLGLTIMVDLDGSTAKLQLWVDKLTAINNILHATKEVAGTAQAPKRKGKRVK